MEESGGQDDEEEANSKDLMDDVFAISQGVMVETGEFDNKGVGRSIRRIMQ